MYSGIPLELPPASFPAPAQLSPLVVRKSGRKPGVFSHASDGRIQRMVKRVCGYPGPRTTKTAKIQCSFPLN